MLPEGKVYAMDTIQFADCEPIFIVGTGRSGTTLLQLLLNAHPNIAVWGEIHFFDQILQIKKWVPSLERLKNLERFFSYLKMTEHYQYLPEGERIFEATKKKMILENVSSYEHFYRIALEEYAKSKGKLRFGDKTPYNLLYLDKIYQIFPKCKIVHILRDPRDVVASYIKLPNASKDVIIHALAWKCFIINSKHFLAKPYTAEKYIELHYENLVCNPEQELRRICGFIGENYSSKMMEFHLTAQRYIRKEPWKEGALSPVNLNSIGRGIRDLPATKIFIIEKIVGQLLKKIGYEGSKAKLPIILLAPFVFLGEILIYLKHRFQRNKSTAQSKDIFIFSDREKFYRVFLNSILSKRSHKHNFF
jgi:hypothetical protein